jgi:hypothetical protein
MQADYGYFRLLAFYCQRLTRTLIRPVVTVVHPPADVLPGFVSCGGMWQC